MRLTDEQILKFKKYNPNLNKKYSCGDTTISDGDLCDTIEALQQEYDELDTGHSKLFKEFCEMKQENERLQAQAARMREAMKQAREALETVTEHLENCYGRDMPDTEKARETLVAIDKIGGQEDEETGTTI